MVSRVGLFFKRDSAIKQRPVNSSDLPSTQRQTIPVGTLLVLQSYAEPSPATTNHYRFSLKTLQIKGFSTNWYAFADHVQLMNQPFSPVQTVGNVLANQQQKDVVKIIVKGQPFAAQGFLKLVFNIDTIIKRRPVDSNVLNDQSKQAVPAGTELVLFTNQPDAFKAVSFSIEDKHVKFTLKDLEFKGFRQDWYAFIDHVGIQPIGFG